LFTSCLERGKTFSSRKLWVAHEFKNHRPQYTSKWHCDHNCGKIFEQREGLERHIIQDHLDGKVASSDVCDIVARREYKSQLGTIQCPFCSEVIKETKTSIQLHIGTHMDEIALKVLPLSDDDSSSVSSRSSLHSTASGTSGSPIRMSHKLECDGDGQTRLHRACGRGVLADVEVILKRDIELINTEDKLGYMPIHDASLNGHLDIVKVLVKYGALYDVQARVGLDSPLLEAVKNAHVPIVEYLLGLGADPRKCDKYGRSCFDAAREGEKPPEVRDKIETLLTAAIKQQLASDNEIQTSVSAGRDNRSLMDHHTSLESIYGLSSKSSPISPPNLYMCPFARCNMLPEEDIVSFKAHLTMVHQLEFTDLLSIPTDEKDDDGPAMCDRCGIRVRCQSNFWMNIHHCDAPQLPATIDADSQINSLAKDQRSYGGDQEGLQESEDRQSKNMAMPTEGQERCPVATCEYSKKGFARKRDRQLHILSHYTRTLTCPFCKRASLSADFSGVETFKEHLTSHFGTRLPILCNVCNKNAGGHGYTAEELYDHLDHCIVLEATGEELKESFLTQDRPLAKDLQHCMLCGKFYHNINAHRLTHELERPEKCPIPSCIYSRMGFVRKYDCIQHTLTHSQALMVCPFCPTPDQKFKQASQFMGHLYMKHIKPGDNGVGGSCSVCRGTFTAKQFHAHLESCLIQDITKSVWEGPQSPSNVFQAKRWSNTSCITCRRRNKKCDGAEPVCKLFSFEQKA
jgi:hypothetical protein